MAYTSIEKLVKEGVLKKTDEVVSGEGLAQYIEKNGGEALFDELFATFTKAE